MAAQGGGGGLSASTLLVASVSSAVAAVIVSQVWRPGAIIGAAVTPIIVAITSELLRKAPEKVTTAVPRARPARSAPVPSAPEDRFGIWSTLDEPPRAPRAEVRRRRALRLAVLTGLVAFVIGAVALTTGELVLGGAVGGGERTTVFGGSDRRSSDRDRDDGPATTDGQTVTETVPAPATDGETVPEATEPAPTTTTPTEPAPGRTTPTVPAPTTPTTPAPGAAPGGSPPG